ncbi:hypothetical protein [Nocardia sp. NPDC024068]|uniref:hypothetical protein n=1 Tax=Nocardia sp. NPDC024068 TaxID=3157197 RepID=UPI0033D2513B
MSDQDPAPASDPARGGRRWSRGLGYGAAVVLCAALAVVLGVANPPRDEGVSTDRLGPEPGDTVAGYLDRARDSLAGPDDGDRWALVSFGDYRTAGELPAATTGVRVGQALYQVPVPRVATPLVAVQVPGGDTALRRSGTDAAWQLTDRLRYTVPDTRPAQILEVAANRLRAGCACAPGVVVRAPLGRLRELADRPGIRAVQALPADAVAGRFAVAPLLPDTGDPIVPPADDGPVPAG